MSEDFSEGLRTRREVLEPRAPGLPFSDTADIGLRVLGRTRWNRKAFQCRVVFAVLAKVGGTWFRGSATVEAYHLPPTQIIDVPVDRGTRKLG